MASDVHCYDQFNGINNQLADPLRTSSVRPHGLDALKFIDEHIGANNDKADNFELINMNQNLKVSEQYSVHKNAAKQSWQAPQ